MQGTEVASKAGTPLLLVPDVLLEKTTSVEVGRSLTSQLLLLSIEGADENKPRRRSDRALR